MGGNKFWIILGGIARRIWGENSHELEAWLTIYKLLIIVFSANVLHN